MGSSQPIRVGIAGARFTAAFHLESIRGVRGVPVEVVGVNSVSRESRERFAAAHDVRAFESLDALRA